MVATINVYIFMVPLSLVPNKTKKLCGYTKLKQSLLFIVSRLSSFLHESKRCGCCVFRECVYIKKDEMKS